MQAPQGMEEGVAQLKAMKQAYDQAVENKDMETIGKIEALVMEMFEATDDPRVKEALSMMFPTMDAMMERPEGEAPGEQMMAEGGKLKMVKNDDGEMVPFYAADGQGKMPHGGVMSPMRKRGVPTNNTSRLELEKQRASSLPFTEDQSYTSLPSDYEAKRLLTEMGYKGPPEDAPDELKSIIVDALLNNNFLASRREGVSHDYSFRDNRNKAHGGYFKMK